jgi:hypothetical protein
VHATWTTVLIRHVGSVVLLNSITAGNVISGLELRPLHHTRTASLSSIGGRYSVGSNR